MAALPLSVYVMVQDPITPLQAQLSTSSRCYHGTHVSIDATYLRPSCTVVFGTTLVV